VKTANSEYFLFDFDTAFCLCWLFIGSRAEYQYSKNRTLRKSVSLTVDLILYRTDIHQTL